MNAIHISAALATIVLVTPTFAQQPASTERLGEHPAVIVKRNFEKQGYDYASKFYPHPAWLYLQSRPSPDDATAVAARRDREPASTTADTAVASVASRSESQR
jgi:hypothetical protein